MPLGDKRLRNCPSEYWTPETLEKAMKENPLNKNDIREIKNAGYYVSFIKSNNKINGSCSPNSDKITILSYGDPVIDMKILLHELLHLVFGVRTIECPDCEPVIEKEAQRIFDEDPELVLKIQKAFKFPKGDIYSHLKQRRLTQWIPEFRLIEELYNECKEESQRKLQPVIKYKPDFLEKGLYISVEARPEKLPVLHFYFIYPVLDFKEELWDAVWIAVEKYNYTHKYPDKVYPHRKGEGLISSQLDLGCPWGCFISVNRCESNQPLFRLYRSKKYDLVCGRALGKEGAEILNYVLWGKNYQKILGKMSEYTFSREKVLKLFEAFLYESDALGIPQNKWEESILKVMSIVLSKVSK